MEERTWSEWFWLPEGYTWKRVDEEIGADYPDIVQFVKWTIFFGALLLVVRNIILIPLLLRPLGRRAGVREKPYPHPPPNEELEILYKINRARPPRKMLVETAAKIEWPERRVERWLRQKTLSTQMTTMEKFCDQGWDAVFYGCFFMSGLFIVVPQQYFWNPMEVMENVPVQRSSSSIWWYSVVDCGFYVTQTINLFSQGRRHDFYVMLAHHMISFLIYFFSVSMNLMKFLTLSVFIHEIADIPLAVAKMFSYSKRNDISDKLAIVFAIVWVCTRLIAYPLMAMNPTLEAYPAFPVPHLGIFCLEIFGTVLFFLHILWTIEIVHSIKTKLTNNKISDSRSSPEELSEEDEKMNSKCTSRITEPVQEILSNNNVRNRKEIRALL